LPANRNNRDTLMLFQLLAEATLLLHLAFILFALLGAALALRWRWMPLLHLPAAVWGFYVEFTGRVCPLTYFENDFRMRAGLSGYQGSFIEHYLLELIYPPVLTREVQFALAVSVVIVNAAIYGWVLYRHGVKPRDGQE